MQKSAYELRMSDWSSDVCSSDLRRGPFPAPAAGAAVVAGHRADAGRHGAALVVDPRAGAALHRGRDDPPRPRAGPPRPVPAAAPSVVHRLADDLPGLRAGPGQLAVAGGDAAGGLEIGRAHV